MTNPPTVVAAVVVDELVRNGVREAVVCPGSRNGPLSFALAAADRAGRLRLHVRVDERTAGFLALGLAAASGAPVPVVVTSGTAVANLHPAVLEADASGVPLLVVSADRPAELVGVGANQTLDQVGLFGGAVRLTAQIPAGIGKSSNAAWRGRVCRTVAAARGQHGRGGPVQLDVAFADPLVPSYDVDPLTLYPGRPDGAPWTWTGVTDTGTAYLGDLVGPRTLVVVGPAVASLVGSAVDAARRTGAPCHVEAGGGLVDGSRPDGTLAAGAWLLGSPALLDAHAPDHVVVVGRPTLGRALGALVSRPGVTLDVIDDRPEWTDPQHAAGTYRCLSSFQVAEDARVDPGWAKAWRVADRAAAETVDRADGLTSGPVARVVARSARGPLVVGSSNPVRDVDLYAGSPLTSRIHANRGLAGIDGTVSTALGIALGTGEPTVALVGDLTFVHDATALVIGPDEPRPDLTVVVVDNDGGGIFGLLEQGGPAYAEDFERVFGTPHGTDLAALCAATGTAYERVTDLDDLARAVAAPQGIRVVHVVVDRAGERDRRATLRAEVDRAVAAALG